MALPGWLRRHWLVVVLLVLGAGLRGVVFAAYHPALIFPDSVRYLQYAFRFVHGHWTVDDQRQSGYSVLITPAIYHKNLWLIPLAQHLAGLATAALVYAVLIRLGARRWLAALATIPVLFDPLQLILEQYVLTDVWTVLLLLAALAILIWRGDGLTWQAAAGCGLLLGLAVTFRDQELIMIVPAVIYLLVAIRPGKRLLTSGAIMIVAFGIPVAGYLGWFYASHGKWNFTTFTGAFLYGRVADFADCTGLTLPDYEKPLCPTQPPAQRIADFYTWNPASPQWTFTPPPGRSRGSVVEDFSLRILRHQPFGNAVAAGRDFLYGFSPVRGAGPEHYPSNYLKFQTHIKPDTQADASLAQLGIKPPASRPGVAAFLADYGRWFYIPGPVLGAGLLLGLGSLAWPHLAWPRLAWPQRRLAWPQRRNLVAIFRLVVKTPHYSPGNSPQGGNPPQECGPRGPATVLFTASAVFVLLPPAMFATFDWRYQLPQLSLIPVAAVLGAMTFTAPRPSTADTAGSGRPASAQSDLEAPPAR